jgi:hypothetical protein
MKMRYTDTKERTKGAMPRASAAKDRDCCQRKKTVIGKNKVAVSRGPGKAKHQVG